MIELSSCCKGYTRDLDKAVSPEQTVGHVHATLEKNGHSLLERTTRIDTGRLGIPVYLSVCGPKAREVMPTRKQMGKGASPAQAEASALMEFIERYSLFSFLTRNGQPGAGQILTWSQAQEKFGPALIPIQEIIDSVHEDIPERVAFQVLDLVPWFFCPAYALHSGREVFLPLDWFQTINEFNGASAGNTAVESMLQGLCELVERHVCARIDLEHPVLPTIDPASMTDPVLHELYAAFTRNNIQVWLKDFSLQYQVPTVGALAYDPATFPEASEIVFTAGTATSPEKAAIRALTEVAQLAGDFESGSCYEPSGLSKPTRLKDCHWLHKGPSVRLSSLPDISDRDMALEVARLTEVLQQHDFSAYSVDTTHPELNIPAHYTIIPGFDFRERSSHPSLGLFVGRLLTEKGSPEKARRGLQVLESIYPQAHFHPFFHGLLALGQGRVHEALQAFARAEPVQPTAQDQAFAAFYQAYCLSQEGAWEQMVSVLDRAIELAPDVQAFYNLRGVAFFKGQSYEQAIQDFQTVLGLDPGAAMDLVNLGICLKRLGKTQEAISYLQAGLELDPGQESARKELEELLARH
ncbi:MAG: YcaO-like family protein [Desulfovermiculus sp.]|nr:YcaO-like family protein [Desulfovermiculus sp.]